ncbi:hypothetical protein JDV02_001973 [Purpureocillium takamizusanense]|uniref:Uncharacterized protein n=1 Tax=Purpureocillium takamizusanense TaxID=2060973 RepID=A0A9Q8V827_9HYPO|nr:uncharacterized protein JDV02_001973 [Purpureocillium takamizusanense]UNI15439.1 hypothetical protein JDV02_001973 [Purpureocillium takamizusanense]
MSGITDEAAIEGHDLIHNAELEEERLHEHDNDQPKAQKPSGELGDAPANKEAPHHKESTLDKVKEALHLKK